MIKQFKVGKSYLSHIPNPHISHNLDCIFQITVIKRTTRSITTNQGKFLTISVERAVEQVQPVGSYPKAPIVSSANELRMPNYGCIDI